MGTFGRSSTAAKLCLPHTAKTFNIYDWSIRSNPVNVNVLLQAQGIDIGVLPSLNISGQKQCQKIVKNGREKSDNINSLFYL